MIITLCGSARFEAWFHMWNEALGLAGHCVFGLCVYPSSHNNNKDWYCDEQKRGLDAVHKDKIRTSDAILVLNVFGYIGDSTMSEIEYARSLGKDIHALESWGKGNGVGKNHHQWFQDAKKKYVPADYVSPIDTFYPYMVDPWVTRLLGEGGERRTRIIRRLKKREGELLNRPYIFDEVAPPDMVRPGIEEARRSK